MKNNIIEKIREYSVKTPGNKCFDSDGVFLTYGELEKASNNLAAYLEKKYPNKDGVLVYGGQDARMLVSFIACTKSGHAYIPVDSHTPKDRVQMIYEESNATCVISFEEWIGNQDDIITKADYELLISKNETPDLGNIVVNNDVYYIIFTSGTTGKPKGVQITYNNLVSFTNWMLSDFNLKREQRFLCQAPFSFDLSVMDLYPCLLTGGTLVPMEKTIVESFPLLFSTIPNLKLNVWVSTPSLVEICLLNPDFNSKKLPSIENFQFCGEELPRQVAKNLLERFPNADIFNTYGPTEATVAMTKVRITKEILNNCDRLPLGKVKSDTKLLILDEKDRVVPKGEIGEIVIVGPGVSIGYFNNTEKTEEAFVLVEGELAYKTGDAGLIKEEMLYYKGRLDFQIKWHGYRIELGDIDHHLMAIKSIRNACVVPKYNKNHKVQQLIAYVVSNQDAGFIEKEETVNLKKCLKESVMDYMVPQRFVYCDSLPLTPNGKVDRKQLINGVNN